MKKIITAIVAIVATVTMCSCSNSEATRYYYGVDMDGVEEIGGIGAKVALVKSLQEVLSGFSGSVNAESQIKLAFELACKQFDGGSLDGTAKLMRSEDINAENQLVNPKQIDSYTFKPKK